MSTATHRARAARRPWIALVLAGLLAGGLAGAVPAAAAGSITGLFSDGWWPEAYQPSRPLNVIAGSMTAVTDAGTVVIEGTGLEDGRTWGVVVYGPDFGRDGLPGLGAAEDAVLNGQGSYCGSEFESSADVLEAEYGADGSVIRFAATVWTRCPATNPPSGTVRTDVRFHSTIGFHAVSIAPLGEPSLTWKPDLDLGDARVGDPAVLGAFTVTNTGSLPLLVGIDPPTDPAFTLRTGSCDGTAIAAATSCSVKVGFKPPTAGLGSWTIDLLTPDLDRPSQPLKIQGRGVSATTAHIAVLDSRDFDQPGWPGLTWFGLGVSPADFKGWADIQTSCGRGLSVPLNPLNANPFEISLDGLPAGPCRVSMNIYAEHDAGFEPSDADPVDFVVPSYSSVNASFDGLPWLRAEAPFDLRTVVGQVNGATPSGGRVSVVDETTGEVLVDRAIAPGELEATTPIHGFTEGDHVLQVGYTGDGIVEPSHRTIPIRVDGTPPEGEIDIEEGDPFTPDPDVSLDLSASDATTDVTRVRVSNASTTSDGLLVGATEVAAVGSLPWTLAPGSGPRKVFVQWRDAVGNWSTPTSDSITVDAVAPAVGLPTVTVRVGAGLSQDRTPLTVGFSATDKLSGIATTRLQVSLDGKAWTDLGAGPSRNVYVTTGHAYRFRGVATDRAGNVATGAPSAAQTVRMTSSASSAVVRRGSWVVAHVAGTLGGTVLRSRTVGSSASITATARGLAIVAPVGPSSGRARVYVDGAYRTTVSLYRSAAAGSRIVYAIRWSAAGRHSIRVVVWSGRVDLDAFAAY